MAEDATDKVDITLRVSPKIKRQIEAVAEANGLRSGEQARQLVTIGLRIVQQQLNELGLLNLDDEQA